MADYINRGYFTISNSPGTSGALTVSTAVSGPWRTLAAADDAKVFDVCIVEGSAWEVRTGCTYTHSGTSLSRGTLEESSTGTAINFTSAATVFVTGTAAFSDRVESGLQSLIPGGRLTLESGVPVSTSDQTAKTSVFYTPYVHNVISLWDGLNWRPTVFAETTLALGTLTSGLPHDVFGYLSGGALTLELLAWTSGTARATAVTLQDGRYCKSGDKTRLLLGTFYTASTTTTEDSLAKRFVCNVYNKVDKQVSGSSNASHTYTTGTWREWNNGTSVNRGAFINSLLGDDVSVVIYALLTNASAAKLGIVAAAINSTTTQTGNEMQAYGTDCRLTVSCLATLSAVGYHYLTALQYGLSNVTFSAVTVRSLIKC